MGIIAGLISMLGWGIADFLAALSSRKFGNVLTLFWMQTVGVLIASIYFIATLSNLNTNSIPQFLPTLLVIAFLQIFAYLSFYKGLEKGLVSIVSPIGASWGLVTAILSIIFYKEILRPYQMIAIVLIVLGIILISINIKELLGTKKVKLLSGVKEGAFAMFGWGVSLFLIVPASKLLGWFLPVYVFRFFALLLLITLIIYQKRPIKIPKELSYLALFLSIGFLDISAFFSYSLGVTGEYASIVAPIGGTFTMVTILLARIFLKERISFNQKIGITGIVAGIILMSL